MDGGGFLCYSGEMKNEIEALLDKWQDVIESSEPDEYEARNIAEEIVEDLTWLLTLSRGGR